LVLRGAVGIKLPTHKINGNNHNDNAKQ